MASLSLENVYTSFPCAPDDQNCMNEQPRSNKWYYQANDTLSQRYSFDSFAPDFIKPEIPEWTFNDSDSTHRTDLIQNPSSPYTGSPHDDCAFPYFSDDDRADFDGSSSSNSHDFDTDLLSLSPEAEQVLKELDDTDPQATVPTQTPTSSSSNPNPQPKQPTKRRYKTRIPELDTVSPTNPLSTLPSSQAPAHPSKKRRKAQNRLAQKAFRDRKASYTKSLESKVSLLARELRRLERAAESAAAENTRVRAENAKLYQLLRGAFRGGEGEGRGGEAYESVLTPESEAGCGWGGERGGC